MPLFASNEPITLSGSRAQRVLHRRINQSFAEYDLLEADLATVDDRETRQRETERDRLQRTLADLARRHDNVMRQAQDQRP